MQSLKILLVSILISCVAVGCGQPGPLYLPDKPTPVNDPAVEAGTGADDTEKKDGEGNAPNP